jgi:hypothetical protein
VSLTIVVPTLARPTLSRTLASLWIQTVPVEFIVASDVRKMGCGPTMNRATQAVTTEYVGFVGDDDRLDECYHEWFLDENRDSDLFIFRMRYEDGGQELPTTSDPELLHLGGAGGTFILRTSVVTDRHNFVTERPHEHYHEDWEMIQWCINNGLKVQISGHVAYYVRH